MRYASTLGTIVAVWIAAILIGLLVKNTDTRYAIFQLVTGFTVVLFVIGVGRK